MSELKREIFVNTLTRPFDHKNYVRFLKELLNDVKLIAPNDPIPPYNTFSSAIKHYRHIGVYEGDDKNKIALFSVCLKNDKKVENARSMQRAFVKSLLEKSDCSGALVAFHTDKEPDKWRLSLVRLDFEFSKGKLSERLTPAKRFSYLVGQGEPCHTAQERLFPIFIEDDLNPSLERLEEAFSVEAVTKDFFDQYREKYLELKEYLDGNSEFTAEAQSRGFDSEQFAKKLMGQIVFLYFIQKKGWLGVNAFPSKLTEREYKAGFYRPGRKPKELMPFVYKQAPDGNFNLDINALLSLTSEDETTLSTLVKGDAWGDGPKDFMRRIFDGCKKVGKNFFDDYLEPLFYTGLNQNRKDNAFFPPLHRRVPFLNGGLFEEMEGYDWRNNDFSIPNELFSNADSKGRDADGILDVFDRYNFTMAEDEPMEREVAIDPEMLGKVFENLLDVTDRKSKGAFYTPREIVHYMCQESLIYYISGKTGISDVDIRKFILYGEYFRDEDTKKTLPIDNETGRVLHGDEIYTHKHHMEFDKTKDLEIPPSILSYKNNVNRLQEIDDLLARVKIVDPAVGSGAFPLGMLTEIVKARDTITAYTLIDMNGYQRLTYRSMRNSYRMKRETIKNSIFACDIEASATDITKLRLWLSLVIDNQIMDQENDDFGYTTKPKELPNLDCNVICGNSLMNVFHGVQLITENSELGNLSAGRQGTIFDYSIGVMINDLIELQEKLYDEKDHIAKDELKKQIQDIYNQIILSQLNGKGKIMDEYYKTIPQVSKPFVLWQMYFPKVFRDNGGFDIVIGNPPYIQLQSNKGAVGKLYQNCGYKSFFKMGDIYCLFIELGHNLLTNNGLLSYINPNTWLQSLSFSPIRKFITTNFAWILTLITPKVFENATVDTHCLLLRKSEKRIDSDVYRMNTERQIYYLHTIPKDQITAKETIINIEANPTKVALIERIIKKATTVGKEMKVYNGVKPFSKGRGIPPQTAEVVKNHPYVKEGKKPSDDWLPLMRGRLMHRYINYWDNNYWILYGNNLAEPRDPRIFAAPEKIIVRQTGDSIIATIIGANIICRNNLHICILANREFQLKYILGVLNSKITNFIYSFLNPEKGEALAEVKKAHVEMLPIPLANKTQQNEIVTLVDMILESKKIGEDTTYLEKNIDEKLYSLYSLKDDEIKMVEEYDV